MQEFPPFRLDPVNQCLWRHRETADDERMLLPPKAFAVLSYLVAHAGRLVPQEELLEAVWPETYVQPEVLRKHIFTIRQALGDAPTQPQFLETLPRRGYRFLAAVRPSPVAAPPVPGPPEPGTLVGHARPRGVAWAPATGRAGAAPARRGHRGAGHRQNGAGRCLPAPGCDGRAGPAPRAWSMY
jgi:DNA-binding winged helix-turn-helix (wHTH) protein